MRDRAKEYYEAGWAKLRGSLSTGSPSTLSVSISQSMRILDLEDALIDLANKYEAVAPDDAKVCSFVNEAKEIKKWRDIEQANEEELDNLPDEDEDEN